MTTELLTGTDEKYYNKIIPYLDTLEKYSPYTNYVFTVGFRPETRKWTNVYHYFLPLDVFSDISTNPCIQAGEFLPYFTYNPKDIIIFTDGDMRLQREFTKQELDLVSFAEEDDTVLAGPNATHLENTLLNELHGLKTSWNTSDIFDLFGEAKVHWEERTLNMGIIICNYKTYYKIFEKTYELFRKFSTVTNHMARQQWFMNLAIYSFAKVKLLPFTFHSHPHNGYQEGRRFDEDGTMYINDTKVLFRHKYYV